MPALLDGTQNNIPPTHNIYAQQVELPTRNTSRKFAGPSKAFTLFAFPNPHELRSSPERVEDGSCGHKRDFALLQPLAKRVGVSPILISLLKVIENTSFAFINLAQDETRVAGRSRAGIHRVRQLRRLGHIVAQESFLSGAVA
jgi:hypothetical protein